MGNDSSMPYLSVIIPIYNVRPYLSRCLDSILIQSYTNLEVICVDDGSTDGSGNIADQYAAKDSRVHVIHKKHGGVVSARKVGIEKATSKYATYVDSDDWIEEEMYEKLMILIIDYDADIVTSGIIRDYGSHTVVEGESALPLYYSGNMLRDMQESLINTNRFFEMTVSATVVWNKIYCTGLLREYQRKVDNQINIGEDVAVAFPCLLNANSVVVSGKNYYHYCIRDDSAMASQNNGNVYSEKLMLEYLQAEFQKKCEIILNINIQFRFLYLYFMLLRDTALVIKYNNGILYPFGAIKELSKIIIYGAGRFGEALIKILREKFEFEVVGWVDKKVKEDIFTPDKIPDIYYDKIIIAVLIADVADDIEHYLLSIDVPKDKIMRIDLQLIGK